MKNQLLFIALFICAFSLKAQTEFITTWKTDNPGTSNATSITIPTFSGETYNYDVDWNNDGVYNLIDIGKTGDVTHDFGAPGTYTIRIRGTFPRIYFNSGGDKDKIISIDQWGTIAWTSMENAFRVCSNLQGNASDVPNLTGVSSLRAMFNGASIFNQDIGNWNVSNVMDFSIMFSGATVFNQDIGQWDTSNATNMQGLFNNATNFNQDIGSWNTAQVTDMSFMFTNATAFNQDIGNWDVQNVNNMRQMFRSAPLFNQNISNWNTANVTSMLLMFADASSFDQNLGSWNVENVTLFNDMFQNVTLSVSNYDALLIGWNNQNLQPNRVFGAGNSQYCNASAERANIIASDGWTITDGGENCVSQSYFKTTWKTDNPGTSNSTSITIPTFSGETYNYDVDWNNDGIFDDIGVTGNITHDYFSAGTYTINIRGDFPRIYFNNSGDKLKILSVDQWGNNSWESMEFAFWGASNLIVNANDAPNLDLVTNLSAMFAEATSFNQDINSWDVSNITNMSGMFFNATSFNQDLDNWDTSSVTNMSDVFNRTASFNGNITNWNTSNVTTMTAMFADATSFNQDISSWDTSNVTSMNSTFANATAFDQNIGGWDVQSNLNFATILTNVTLSEPNYDALLIGWNSQNLQPNRNFNAGNSQYCSQAAADARANMIASDGWTITDGGACFTLGINDYELNKIALYPNPSKSEFSIQGLNQATHINIYDITGKVVRSINDYRDALIDVRKMKSGLYLVEVKNQLSSKTLKLIID